MEFSHTSVLLGESVKALGIQENGIYMDGTAGGGGHSYEIAKRLGSGKLVAVDQDPDAIEAVTKRLEEFCDNVIIVQNNFRNADSIVEDLGLTGLDGVLLDLGVSSHQLDTGERGFSYHYDAPLDMRMSQAGISARDVVNTYSVDDLTRILRDYGEEKFAYRIAKTIVEQRSQQPVETTGQLIDLIKKAVPAAARREKHPARRTFQAIRIEVNQELEALEDALDRIFGILRVGGRLAVITFHSLEDRMVKQKFVQWCQGCTCPPDFPVCVCGNTPRAKKITGKPVTASATELEHNARSRSAKLRVVEKIKE